MERTCVGKRIKYERQRLGLTQEELANMIGVTKNCVGAWETGRNLPDILTVNDLSLMFKIPIDYFLKDDSFGVGEESVGYHTSVADVIRLTDKEILTIKKLRSMKKDLRNAFETILGVR